MQSTVKILAPIDLRRESEGPVRHAISVANELGGELLLLYAANRHSRSRASALAWPPSALNPHLSSVDVHRLVLPGRPAAVIARYAEFVHADLLVLPAQTHGGWRSWWRTSTIAEVQRTSRCPIWLTGRKLSNGVGDRCRRLLCVVRLDGCDGALLEHAVALTRHGNAELVLLHVLPPASEALLAQGVAGATGPLSRDVALLRMHDLTRNFGVPYLTSIMAGDPGRCLGVAVREHNAGLVLASRSVSGLDNSHAANLDSSIHSLPCPLLTIPSDVGVAGNLSSFLLATARSTPA